MVRKRLHRWVWVTPSALRATEWWTVTAHARVCPYGGNRTKRHRLRTVVAAGSHVAGFHIEVKKNLVLSAPEDGGRWSETSHVWIGNWRLLGPAVLDLAMTSGMRLGSLAQTAANGKLFFPSNARWLSPGRIKPERQLHFANSPN